MATCEVDSERCLFLDEQYNTLAGKLRWEKAIRDSQSERNSRQSKRREAHNGEDRSDLQQFFNPNGFSTFASAEEKREVGNL